MSSIVGMTTIIYGSSHNERISHIDSIIEDARQSKNRISVDVINVDKHSIGIGEIRSLIDKSNYTSLSAQKRYFVIYDAHKLTEQAQNALLKLYEEPHPDTVYILELESYGALLPTIISRSALYNISSGETKVSLASLIEKNEFPDADAFKKLLLPELFKVCEEYAKDKSVAKDFLTYLMLLVSDTIRITSSENRKKGIAYMDFLIQSSYWLSNTNVGVRLLLENCVLGFIRI
ncbi:MAG: hypothetical protein M3Q44_01635 [bacterium]|nr:hypothetical protein [bacterium]